MTDGEFFNSLLALLQDSKTVRNGRSRPVLGVPLGAGAAHVVALGPIRIPQTSQGPTKIGELLGQVRRGLVSFLLLVDVTHGVCAFVCHARIVFAFALAVNQLVVLGRCERNAIVSGVS